MSVTTNPASMADRDGLPPDARRWAMLSVAIGVGMA